jgi:hypothetical protein
VADLLLTFRKDVPEERRDAILKDVGLWPEVEAAAMLRHDAPTTALRRFSYVRVQDQFAERVVQALRDLPEVEVAEHAPQRGV